MSTAETLKAQGIEHYKQYDYEAAIRAFQEALDAYAAAGQPEMAAEMRVNIGLAHRALGETQQALDMIEAALRTFQEMDDKMRTAQALGNLGGVYVLLNDKEQAELSYRQAAQLFEELDEQELYTETMLAISAMQVRDLKLLRSAATYHIALEGKEELTHTQKVLKAFSTVLNRVSGFA